MIVNALTHRPGGILNVIETPVEIKNPFNGNVVKTLAIWDTGATSCAITEKLAQQLSLPIIAKGRVLGVHGEREVNVHDVEIKLNNENIQLRTRVSACSELSSDGSIGLLLGMDVITKGDFFITNHNGNTVMTFRVPSLETKDFCEEIKEYNRFSKIHDIQRKKGITKCPCGSGKDFKNCHGKSIYNQ